VVRVAVVSTGATDGQQSSTDGAELHTTAIGDTGPRVAFLHGLFGQGRNWTQIGKALAHGDPARPHRVLLVDLPHHGRSSWDDRFDYLRVADQVARVLEPDGPVALVGHSLGGKVAMVLALRHPGLVERLCVVDVSPVPYNHLSQFERYVEAMRGLDLASLSQRGDADTAMSEAVPDATVRAFLLQNLRRDGDGWRWQMNLDVLGDELAVIGGWPEEQLAGVPAYDAPVLWIAGERSEYVAPAYAAAMDRWFPRNRLTTVKNAGHWVHSEQPEVFVEVLRRFLDGAGAGHG
jgi:pimeloyl-ACP methyl ester carboxylesterase